MEKEKIKARIVELNFKFTKNYHLYTVKDSILSKKHLDYVEQFSRWSLENRTLSIIPVLEEGTDKFKQLFNDTEEIRKQKEELALQYQRIQEEIMREIKKLLELCSDENDYFIYYLKKTQEANNVVLKNVEKFNLQQIECDEVATDLLNFLSKRD